LIDEINRFLCHRLSHKGIYASFYAIFIGMEQASMDYAGADHPPALHYQALTGTIDLLQSETAFVGIDHPLLTSSSMNRHRLAAGDKILLYTDGVNEAADNHGKMFGTQGIKRILNARHDSGSAELNNAFVNELTQSGDYIIGDDMMLMSVTIKS
jgi:sigma-B regulation protein RsbU (phosphoserine phosphatase)